MATAEIDIAAAPDQVWKALTDPALISEYMFGSQVETDWLRLVVTHYSPMSGEDDTPENYHTLTYGLRGDGATTHLSLSQDNNADAEEAERSRSTWATVLAALKDVAERR